MTALRAKYEDGKITFDTHDLPKGKMDVIVNFPVKKISIPETQPKMTGPEFLQKWKGILEDVEIEDWRDVRLKQLENKHL